MEMALRLNKFLAARLGLSRREADAAIASGKVTIDGKPAVLGAHIDKTNKVCYNGKHIPYAVDYLYVAMNKPVGYVCSRRAQGSAPTLYELLPAKYHNLKTVGRLDKDSSGLILLTNDGDFAFQMTHPKFHKEKVYEVELNRPLEPLHQQMISDYGIMLEDGPSKFTIVKQSAPTSQAKPPVKAAYTVILSEGRNRQIRRTFAALGYKVTKLHRTQFGKYQLSGLEPGQCVIIKP
ncbi:rRNA pseudouridine synthase [Candidatus Saccharibacteria bacterium]|nr:rRNA pseudouridine synthase [Candidatus Saccharibacteria bacterium]MBQ6593598.1 rRNA pseudouridine synthase [Candidatus Saccharibacteria bacterium]